MGQLLSSKVIIEEEEPRVRSIDGVQTSICGFLGLTEKGPVGVPTLCQSYDEFVAVFGSFIANSDLVLALLGFFENGGKNAWVVRVVHYTDITNAATKTSAKATLNLLSAAAAPTSGYSQAGSVGPYNLAHNDTLVVTIDGGAPATATFQGTAAARESGAENFALVDGQTLTVSIDGGGVQTITFATANFVAIGAATAEEVAAVINGQIVGATATVTSAGTKVTITSDRKGTGSGVNVTGGAANAVLGFAVGNIAGGGNVSNIDAVTTSEVKTIVEAAVAGCTVSTVGGASRITSNTTGATSTVLVGASSTADDEMGFDNATHAGQSGAAAATLTVEGKYDGAYANDIRPIVKAATSGDADLFDLCIEDNGLIVETWPNVSMLDTHERYVETIVNDPDTGSKYVKVIDLDNTAPAPGDRPANGTFGPLTGGNDGVSGLADADFIGNSASATGLRALDTVADLSVLAVPGRATSAMHNAMITYCEVTREGSVFAVLDPPSNQTATQIKTYVESTAALLNLSEFGAMYWPRVEIVNPSKAVYGNTDTIYVYPSGHICGVYARTDAAKVGGVFTPPAGTEAGRLLGVVGFEGTDCLDEAKRDLVFPSNINPLTVQRGTPRYIDGARTLKGNGNFPTVAERRGVIFIEQSIKNGLLFAKHKNNDEDLRATCDRSVRAFLLQQMGVGAFASKDPSKAFFTDFGKGLNPDTERFARKLNGRVGLATQKPAEFIIVRFSQDTRAIDAEIAAGQG